VDLHWLFTSFRPTLTESGQQVRELAGDILGPIEMLGKVNVSMVPNSGTLPQARGSLHSGPYQKP